MVPTTPAAVIVGAADEPWTVSFTSGHAFTSVASQLEPNFSKIAAADNGSDGHQIAVLNGDWVKSVHQIAPFLNGSQLHEALGILDRAMANAQEMKVLDAVEEINQKQRQERLEEQSGLLSQLQSLRSEATEHGFAVEGQVITNILGAPRSSLDESSTFALHGEWVNSIQQIAPFLNASQLRGALGILDRAVANTQQIKVLDTVGNMAAVQRQQRLKEQVGLFSQLQTLRLVAGAFVSSAGRDSASPEACACFLGPPPGLEDQLTACVPAPSSSQPAGSAAVRTLEQDARLTLDTPLPQRELTVRFSKAEVQPSQLPQAVTVSVWALSNVDPQCVFVVRHIAKLGFKAARTLRQHFSMQGPVVQVLLQSPTKTERDAGSQVQGCPSNLGLVHMLNAECVNQILANGHEQGVGGVIIGVQKYQPGHGDVCRVPDWVRNVSTDSGSTLSCATFAQLAGTPGATPLEDPWHGSWCDDSEGEISI